MDTVPLDSIDVNHMEFREMAPEDADAVEIVEKACFAIPGRVSLFGRKRRTKIPCICWLWMASG